MKVRAVLGTLAVAALAASAATAAPPAGKGHPTTGTGCKPAVAVILTGTLTADGAAAPSSLSVHVTGGNHSGQRYKDPTLSVSVGITTSTRINRAGHHSATDLKSGDLVNVQARACRADLANGAKPALTAKRVTAHPASS